MRTQATQEFYQSKLWRKLTKYIWIKQKCLCKKCGLPVYIYGISSPDIPKEHRRKGIVHHIEHLNDNNLAIDEIALDEKNLEGLCLSCHNSLHFSSSPTREDLYFDEEGNLKKRELHPFNTDTN